MPVRIKVIKENITDVQSGSFDILSKLLPEEINSKITEFSRAYMRGDEIFKKEIKEQLKEQFNKDINKITEIDKLNISITKKENDINYHNSSMITYDNSYLTLKGITCIYITEVVLSGELNKRELVLQYLGIPVPSQNDWLPIFNLLKLGKIKKNRDLNIEILNESLLNIKPFFNNKIYISYILKENPVYIARNTLPYLGSLTIRIDIKEIFSSEEIEKIVKESEILKHSNNNDEKYTSLNNIKKILSENIDRL